MVKLTPQEHPVFRALVLQAALRDTNFHFQVRMEVIKSKCKDVHENLSSVVTLIFWLIITIPCLLVVHELTD